MKASRTSSAFFPLVAALLACSTSADAKPARIEVIGHQVDVQTTFAESFDGSVKGSLAVPGSAATIPNIARLAKAFATLKHAKSVASIDYHYAIEMRPKLGADGKPVALTAEGKQPLVNDEFQIFPSHGRAERDEGADGHERIPEVANLFPARRRLVIPHHRPNAAGTDLELVAFDVRAHERAILGPRTEIVIQKNGPLSYDVFQNPRAAAVYAMINPTMDLPIYVYGWATDFCVRAAALGLAKLGYTNVLVVTDAISGVFPDKSAATLEELKRAGVRFTTTDQALATISGEDVTYGPIDGTPRSPLSAEY